jgi:hypothetical protein
MARQHQRQAESLPSVGCATGRRKGIEGHIHRQISLHDGLRYVMGLQHDLFLFISLINREKRV